MIPSRESQQAIVKMVNTYIDTDNSIEQLRSYFRQRDLEYYRETDKSEEQSRASSANAAGDARKIQNPTVPVVAPQVETALANLVDIFLSSYPVFPVVAKPQLQESAMAIETVLGESSVHFRWPLEFSRALRDGLKYNLLAVEVDWCKDKVFSVENRSEQELVFGVPVETVFEGNKVKRLDPYNLILDKRVRPSDIHTSGDYAGYSELLTRMQLKRMIINLDSTQTMNAREAYESATALGGARAYYVPEITSKAQLSSPQGMNWLAWANLQTQDRIRYQDMYEVTHMYARVVPKELGLTGERPGTPQIYRFILVNRSVCILAQRLSNAHDFLPIVVGQLVDDGLGYQTKSIAEQAAPYQAIATSLWTSAIASQRRKVYDRLFYDPSRINKKDIDNTDPVARIAVKSEVYGKPISEAIWSSPYRDDTVPTVLGMAREVTEMANVSSGQNRVTQGQFQKGNKTRFEVDQVMTAADARPRMYAVLLESAWFQPIKHILKSNILQYQPPTTLYNRMEGQQVQINPADFRKQVWEFKVADGILPVDRLVNMETLNYALQLSLSQPAIGAQYDVLGMFFYMMQVQGANWIKDFQRSPEQVAALQATQSQQGVQGGPITPV
jgi:hypothetical protein